MIRLQGVTGWFFSALLLCVSANSLASVLAMQPYRDAQLVKSYSKTDQLMEVPLSKISRSGRGWEPDTVVRLQGDYFSSLYKINRNILLTDVYAHYRSQMLLGGRTVVFECESRSCGSSNAWANDFFGDYLLYGADQSQYLLVVKNRQEVYQVLYLNRRGAGDVMVRLDEMASSQAKDTEFEIVAQMPIQDTPRIRRFLNDLPPGQMVVGFVTSESSATMSAIQSGDRWINQVSSGLGAQLVEKVRFINLADLGRPSLGVDRVSFVYARP
ncbi:DUF4892 domain-containing protein [Marinomonas sp. A79]|uniref:DUF4892 domain-containing protein n=1 Tax=Marinomonas vulgaris TaxID=2823372 RepID=A0ABS5HAA8_9GAMM|nr:DUF4892 domain-containing protein [Marinomonas vulgaris]MBR7888535.1 DUF4892 domain-containing protein [Marinomonas vulgaris]